MGLSAWTISKENAGNVVSEVASGALDGGFSLNIHDIGGGRQVIGRATDGNVTSGRLRTWIKPNINGQNQQGPFSLFGMMQSSINFASNAYHCLFQQTTSFSTSYQIIGLYKGNVISTAVSSLLASATIPTALATNVLRTIQFIWQLDAISGSVFLAGYVGTLPDFSDLAQLVSYTDSSSPYSTAVSCGFSSKAGGGDATHIIDVTQGYRI